MKRELIQTFNRICKANRDVIGEGKKVVPVCILIGKKDIVPIFFQFKTHDEKVKIRNNLKQQIIKRNIKGYIMCFDTKLTKIDTKGKKKPEVLDCIVNTLYTPKEKRVEMMTYKGKKILGTKRLTKEDTSKMKDEWDLWREGVPSTWLEGDAYHKFNMRNKELYDGVVEPFEDWDVIVKSKTTGKVIIALKFDHAVKKLKVFISLECTEQEGIKAAAFLKEASMINKMGFNYEIKVVNKDD